MGFDAEPKKCYEMTKQFLPFGCPAWEKYDREFWKNILMQNKKISRRKYTKRYRNG